jgi:hypothetical protein
LARHAKALLLGDINTRAGQPPEQDLGSARVCACAFSQPTLDIAVGRSITVATGGAARRLKGVDRVFGVGCA